MREKPKPIRRQDRGVRSIFRIPEHGALTPRLRDESRKVEAIGFVADFNRSNSDRDDDNG